MSIDVKNWQYLEYVTLKMKTTQRELGQYSTVTILNVDFEQ